MGAYEVWLAGEIYDLIKQHVKDKSLGRVVQEMIFDLRPTIDRERRPDVAYISYERWARNRRVPKLFYGWSCPTSQLKLSAQPTRRTKSLGSWRSISGWTSGVCGWFIHRSL